MTLPLLCYAAIALLSVFWVTNPVEGLIQIARLFTFFLLALLAAHALSPAAIHAVCAAGALAGALVSCIGIAQYFGWAFSNIPTVGNPGATFGHRNYAASYLVASIPLAAAFAWTSATRLALAGWSLSAALMALFLAYTRTRGAWVGLGSALLLGGVLLLWLRLRYGTDPIGSTRSRLRIAVVLVGVFLVGLGALLPHRMQREGKFRFDEKKSDVASAVTSIFKEGGGRDRPIRWWHTLEMAADHPFLGVGLGSWQYVYPRYDRGDSITDIVAPQRPHNDLLWILSETGTFGLAAYLWILYTLCRMVVRALKTSPKRPETLWMFGIGLGILALVGHSLFSFPRERAVPSMLFWMGLGFTARLAAEQAPRSPSARIPTPLFGTALALAAALLLCALTLTYRHIRFDAAYLRALTAWRQEDWPRTASQTGHALRWGPLNHRTLLLHGLAHQKLGNLKEAAGAYTTVLRYHPNDGHAALAATYADLGNHELAAAHYRRELQLYPKSVGAALGLADAYRRLGRWDEAVKIYRASLTTAPDSADIYTKLGSALQDKGDLDGALDAYTRALAPGDPRSYNNLGAVLALQGRLSEAEEAYSQALRIRPDYARPYHNLGDLYAAKKDTASAVDAYEKFIQTWKGDTRFLELARRKIRDLKGNP